MNVLLGTLLVIITACGSIIEEKGDDKEAPAQRGSPSPFRGVTASEYSGLSFMLSGMENMSGEKLTLNVSLLHPESGTAKDVSQDFKDGEPLEVNGLVTGLWKVSIEILAAGSEIFSGMADAEVKAGELTSVKISPTALEPDTGGIVIIVELPPVDGGEPEPVPPAPEPAPDTCESVIGKTAPKSTLSGVINSDLKLTAEQGPYLVSGSLQIPSGRSISMAAGTMLLFEDKALILVQGSVNIDGSKAQPVVFEAKNLAAGNNAAFLLFHGSDLGKSAVNYMTMVGATTGIQVGQEMEHAQGGKNKGILQVNSAKLCGSEIRTGGYQTGAKLVMNDPIIEKSRIVGEYPRSEAIEVNRGKILGSAIQMESYNGGLTLNKSELLDSTIILGCCEGGLTSSDSLYKNVQFSEDPYSSPGGTTIAIRGGMLQNSSVNLPNWIAEFSLVTFDMTPVVIGFGNIVQSFFDSGSPKQIGTGLEIMGKSGILVRKSNLDRTYFSRYATGLKVSGGAGVSFNEGNFALISGNLIENRSSADVETVSVCWNDYDPNTKMFDYFDDIHFGKVLFEADYAAGCRN